MKNLHPNVIAFSIVALLVISPGVIYLASIPLLAQSSAPSVVNRAALEISKEEAQALEIAQLKAQALDLKLKAMAQHYQDQFAAESAPLQQQLQAMQREQQDKAQAIRAAHKWGPDVQFDEAKREFYQPPAPAPAKSSEAKPAPERKEGLVKKNP